MHKILFIKANPIDTKTLRLEKEENEIRDALMRSDNKENYLLESRGAVTKDSLLNHILKIKPHILHISGHGDNDDCLFLEDSEGYRIEVSIEKFWNFIGNFRSHINCVFLNACHSLSNMNISNNKIRYIIGMRKEISDGIAIDFSAAFYKSLFSGKTVKESFKIALDIISLTSFDDELIPKLIESRVNRDSGPVVSKKDCQLISEEEIDRVKKEKIKNISFYNIVIFSTLIAAIALSVILFIYDTGLVATLLPSLFSPILGILPFVEIRKNKEKIVLFDLYKLKRNRLLRAISNLTDEDIAKFNDEFYYKIMV